MTDETCPDCGVEMNHHFEGVGWECPECGAFIGAEESTTDDTITTADLTHSDIGRLIDDLNAVRNRFGRYEDDYRQAKVDVAIQQLEDIGELIAELQTAGEWEDPDLYGVPTDD